MPLARTDWIACTFPLLVAAAVRVAFHVATPLIPPMSDMAEYWERGTYIFEHGSLYPNAWRMPGLPISLALGMQAVGDNLAAARLVNVIAGGATAAMTYLVARQVTSRCGATAAALIVALYPTFIVYTSLVATESLVTVPVLVTMLLTLRSSATARAGLGAAAALATLVRPAGIALLPIALLVPLVSSLRQSSGRRPAIVDIALILGGFALVMTPWWVHTARLYGRPVFLDTTGGINLLLGNSPLTTGTFKYATVVRLRNEYVPGIDTTTPEGSARATAAALQYLRDAPAAALASAPRKLAALFALEGREHAYLYSVGYFGSVASAKLLAWGMAVLAAFPLLVVAALAGWSVRAPPSPVLAATAAFGATTIAMHLASFGDPRFHLPFVPLLAVVAGRLAWWRAGFSLRRLATAVIVVVALAFAWRPQLVTYLRTLDTLSAPGGSASPINYDDLL